MDKVGKILLGMLFTAGLVAVDELVRSNVRKFIKSKFFNDTKATPDEEIHSGCCNGCF